MKSKSTLIIVAVVGVLILAGIMLNNGLISKEEAVNGQWAQVQNSYQRRADLIPNLVQTVKGYAAHEQETLQGVVEARANATKINLNADQLTEENLKKYQEAQGQLGAALGRLLAVQENYPDLKANTNFLALQDELAGTENRISTERKRFNDMVQEYNKSIRTFPRSIIASFGGFEKKAYFEADAASQTAPKVEF